MADQRDHRKTLDELLEDARTRYPEQTDRLDQLDGHVGTVRMVLDHMADEHVRHGHAEARKTK